MQLRLNTPENTRRSLCRLLRHHVSMPADPDQTAKFRAAIYGFSTLLAYDRAAEVSEVAAKLTELDRRLAEAGR